MDWTWIIIGCLVGFFGWMVYRAGLSVIGALIGASTFGLLGYFLGNGLVTGLNLPGYVLPMAVVGTSIAGMLVGIFTIKALQLYFFFIAGASLGAVLGLGIGELPVIRGIFDKAAGPIATLILSGVTALACGLLLVKFRRYIIAVVTSVMGGFLVSIGLPPEQMVRGMIVAVVTFLVIQIGLVRRFVDELSFDMGIRRRFRQRRPDV